MALGDFQTALEMRDLIQTLVRNELETQRPRYQYATVTSIDRVTRKCGVQFPGEAGSVSVNMGSIQPMTVGQVVRVEGLQGDRFISDVLGEAFNTLEADFTALQSLVNTIDAEQYVMARVGTFGIGVVNAGFAGATVSVTFSTPFPTGKTIQCVVQPGSGRITGNVINLGVLGFDYTPDNWSTGNASSTTARYIAVGY